MTFYYPPVGRILSPHRHSIAIQIQAGSSPTAIQILSHARVPRPRRFISSGRDHCRVRITMESERVTRVKSHTSAGFMQYRVLHVVMSITIVTRQTYAVVNRVTRSRAIQPRAAFFIRPINVCHSRFQIQEGKSLHVASLHRKVDPLSPFALCCEQRLLLLLHSFLFMSFRK